MPDDLDAFLRVELWDAGARWAPDRPVDKTRADLARRIRRRRRAQAVLAASALGSVTIMFSLGHVWASGAAIGPGRLTADPPTYPGSSLPAEAPPSGGRPPTATTAVSRSPDGSAGQRAASNGASHRASAPLTPPGPEPTTWVPTTTTLGTVAPPPPTVSTTSTSTTPPTTLPTTTTVPPSTTTTVTPVTSTTVPAVYIYTNADSGDSAQVPVGATIALDLTACAGTTWSPVQSSAPGVVAPVATAPQPGSGSVVATLIALGEGVAELRVLPHSTCATPAATFVITIQVTQPA